MSTKLNVDFISHDAAKFAVENFHYSQSMPSSRLFKLGVWEDDKFIGAVIFGRGANKSIAVAFGMNQTQVVELCRVALKPHKTPVTRIVSICMKMLKKENPGLEIVVSYSDGEQKHLGKIYQAGNWAYLGAARQPYVIDPRTGETAHPRTLNSVFGSVKGFKYVEKAPKHKYAYPLTERSRLMLESMSKPYPKALEVLPAAHSASSREGAVQI